MRPNDFVNKHKNETIYILGNGPQLAYLTNNQINKLKEKITIGLNYSQLVLESSYYISGHLLALLHYIYYCKDEKNIYKFFQGDTFKEKLKYNKNHIVKIKGGFYSVVGSGGLPSSFYKGDTVVGAANIGLSATHLSYIMGAKRIVYLGVELNNRLHFYNCDGKMIQRLKKDFLNLKNLYNHNPRILASIQNAMGSRKFNGFLPKESLKKMAYRNSPLKTFGKLFCYLKKQNIDIITTTDNSKLLKINAKYIPLDEVLEKY